MDSQVQTGKSKNRTKKKAVGKTMEQTEEKTEDILKAEERQKVTRIRIENIKKAFKSQWLIRQINSVDDKKENNT